jgi:integration host factor subunit alpha
MQMPLWLDVPERRLVASAQRGSGEKTRMAASTVTRAQLAEALYEQVGLSRNESAQLVESVLDIVTAALEAGQPVKISSFGTFAVRQKGRRIGRNPKTGIEVPILPRKVLVFRPSQVLKARVNGLAAPEEDDA